MAGGTIVKSVSSWLKNTTLFVCAMSCLLLLLLTSSALSPDFTPTGYNNYMQQVPQASTREDIKTNLRPAFMTSNHICNRFTLEGTNLRQLQYFIQRKLNNSHLTLDKLGKDPGSSYVANNHTCPSVWVVKPTSFQGGHLVTITETECGLPSKGGSSFKVTLQGLRFLTVCPVEDYFNGTYHAVCCPPYPECANISIQAMFRHFMAFKRKGRAPQNKLIWQSVLCTDTVSQKLQRKVRNCKEFSKEAGAEGYWRITGTTKRWENNGCTVPRPSDDTKFKCLKDLHSITLIGDSHLRYAYLYLAKMKRHLYRSTPNRFKEASIDNVSYHESHFSVDLPQVMSRYLNSPEVRTKKDVLILDTGAWDIHNKMLHDFVGGMRLVFAHLAKLRASRAWRNSTIIWLTTSAFPEGFVSGPRRKLHNNYMTAAYNGWSEDKLRGLGLHLVDMFQYTFPRTAENVCDKHFLCRDEATNEMYGDVGISVMDAIFHIMCNNNS